ncbi:MAG: enolase C-terminal domain-like protein, partial [Bryobacteraceae bacterium]
MPLSAPPAIRSVEAFPVRLPREAGRATGTAGSPTHLGEAAGAYRWSAVYPALYSEYFETVLVRVTLDDGAQGWGEAQAPLAPRVAATIIEDLLAPVLAGQPFDGCVETVRTLWLRMYQTMRVRGQTSGFMLDAISGVDLALWDLAGKLSGRPVAALVEGAPWRSRVPAYLSGLSGADRHARLAAARAACEAGFRLIKVFFDCERAELLHALDDLAATLDGRAALAVDALWRLELPGDEPFLRELERLQLAWLECPFPPDEIEPHRRLAASFDIPVAVGESYRGLHELEPFLREGLIRYVQPDLGRCGLTLALRIAGAAAAAGVGVAPHVSIALGPQIAAAVHFSAAAGCQ